MRRVLCEECGKKYPTSTLKTVLFPRGHYGEPEEYGRIIKGIALEPKPEQRRVFVNDAPFALEGTYYGCDMCGEKIKPGDKATCLTVWNESQPIPDVWEREFIRKDESQ